MTYIKKQGNTINKANVTQVTRYQIILTKRKTKDRKKCLQLPLTLDLNTTHRLDYFSKSYFPIAYSVSDQGILVFGNILY